MRVNKLPLIILMLFSFVAVSLSAVTYDNPVVYISPVTSAVGGPHVTMNGGFSDLFNNPAGFRSAEEEISLAEITTGLKGPVFDIANMFVTGDYSNITSIFQGIYAGMDLLGPVAFGYIGNGLGFGIVENTVSSVSSTGPLTVEVEAGEEIILSGGYAFRVPLGDSQDNVLDLGMLLKGTFKGTTVFEESVLNIMNISVDSLLNSDFDFVIGIGFDLGVRYTYRNVFTAGLTAHDPYSPTIHNLYSSAVDFASGSTPVSTTYGLVPFRLDAGVMYSPDFSEVNSFISGLKVFADYFNVFDFWLYPSLAVNPVLHIGVGTEVTLLEILKVRAGFNQGLFAAGLGLDLHYFTLNAAMFGTELSTEPGLHPVYNVQIGLEFRI